MPALVVPAQAQPFPSRPIRLVVGQAPGGHSDVLARAIAQGMSEALGQSVVVENRGGAGGTIGADIVAHSPADGYTLLLAGSNNLGLAFLVSKDLRYASGDFASVGGVARVHYAIAAHSSIPGDSIADIVAYARANPGRLTYVTSGPTSMSALGFDTLRRSANIDIVAIAYKGSGSAVNDFLSGRVQMMFTDLSMLATLAAKGSVRLVAVAGSARTSLAPGVATVAEQGFAELAIEPWYGIVVPSGTPPGAVARLSSALRDSLQAPQVKDLFERSGYVALDPTPASLDALIEREVEKFQSLVEAQARPR